MVVAELVGLERAVDRLPTRCVDGSLVEWTDASALGRCVGRADVAPALVRGDQRVVRLELLIADARFDDRSVAIELVADYDDAARNKRLALVLDDSLIQLPAQHTFP